MDASRWEMELVVPLGLEEGDRVFSTLTDAHDSPDRHWGQGVVSWAGTSQVHHKDMDKVPGKNPPGTSQVHSEFSQPVSL